MPIVIEALPHDRFVKYMLYKLSEELKDQGTNLSTIISSFLKNN